jgi:hypothetical protein
MAMAGQINNATITRITNDENGIVRITLNGGSEITPKAGCSSSSDGRELTYDLNAVAGKGWHSIALTALATSKPVHVIGKNTCGTLWGSNAYENVGTLYIMQ